MEITTEEYRVLFNTISDTICMLESLLSDLVHAQQISCFISSNLSPKVFSPY